MTFDVGRTGLGPTGSTIDQLRRPSASASPVVELARRSNSTLTSAGISHQGGSGVEHFVGGLRTEVEAALRDAAALKEAAATLRAAGSTTAKAEYESWCKRLKAACRLRSAGNSVWKLPPSDAALLFHPKTGDRGVGRGAEARRAGRRRPAAAGRGGAQAHVAVGGRGPPGGGGGGKHETPGTIRFGRGTVRAALRHVCCMRSDHRTLLHGASLCVVCMVFDTIRRPCMLQSAGQ